MANPTAPVEREKWQQLIVLSIIQLLAMSLWFSASSVTRGLRSEWNLSSHQEAWLTISVQVGFVIGALVSAIFNLSDRIAPPRLLATCALAGAMVNGLIPFAIGQEFGTTSLGFATVIFLRMLTGVLLAGVYPTGMKLTASWFAKNRGLAIGILVGSLTVGSASPHLLQAFLGQESVHAWRPVMIGASVCAFGAFVLGFTFVKTGPNLPAAAKFDLGYFVRIWTFEPVRRANFGYLGHMFEVYAMWAWAPKLLAESYEKTGFGSAANASLIGFITIAIGGIGSVIAGAWAERIGRCWTTIVSLAISGTCALIAGHLVNQPAALTIVCLIWGFAVVADSAQFSTAVSELCDPRYVGTALTIQTCSGFLLTTLTIWAVPTVHQMAGGWSIALSLLAIGPVFGIWHMFRLWKMVAGKQTSL